MKILIDTHCWLWWRSAPESLNREALVLISERRNAICLSAASAWEIAIKFSLGKLRLPEPPAEYVAKRLVQDSVFSLPVDHTHALRVASLPLLHNDPFDRLLVVQAQIEHLVLLTADRQITQYDVETVWAGAG